MIDYIVQEIERYGFAIQPELLKASDLDLVNHFIDEHQSEFRPAMVGPKDKKQRDESIRGDYTFWIDPLKPADPFRAIIDFLENLRLAVNQHFYLGLQQFECHLASYSPGTFYKKHLDRFETNSSRSLTFVLYLNQKWSKEDGGELILYNNEGDILKTILPSPGLLVCFLSDAFPHEVKSGKIERRSFTGWMHTKIIY